MKKKTKLILTLILTGCMALGGCGNTNNAATATNDDAQTTDTTENAALPDTGISDNTSAADTTADTTATADEAADTSDLTGDTADNPQVSGETHSVTGIITDASNSYLSFQTPEGASCYLTIPQAGVTGNLSSITIGQIVMLTYTGSLDENHATLTDISASSMITGIYTEEYAFALKIITAVREMDINKLRELINFPLFIDTGTYAGPMNDDVFRYMNSEDVFTKELVLRLSDYNLFDLQYTYAGFVMGDGGPNITFGVDDDGILGITGINCTAVPTSAVSANSASAQKTAK